jgi:hypothetical protein
MNFFLDALSKLGDWLEVAVAVCALALAIMAAMLAFS